MRIASSSWWLLLPCLVQLLSSDLVRGMTINRRIELREEVREMFKHGFEGYMTHAYPADELKPLSCIPSYRDPDVGNFGINDIHANASMTLLDTLSTLPDILPQEFPGALEKVAKGISFNQDVKVQVFEMTIRALGGLLSTYQYLESLPVAPQDQAKTLGLKQREVDVKVFQPRILELALDLGERLLPAFRTSTGIPFARVNLRYGVEAGESEETCTAGAGSLILEFGVLSRLTGDRRFEDVARKAYQAVWDRRSPHNLLGNTIGAEHGQWLAPGMSGIQAGMDSYFEYAIKGAILLGDDTYLDIFDDAYAAIQTFVRTNDGFIYRPVQFRTLQIAAPSTVDSLSAFFAGVQVLNGDLESAIRNHLVHWNLWRRYSGSPESWTWSNRDLHWTGWPGRPEFVESTYYLYQATRDPFYLRVGERVLEDIQERVRTKCGFATMKDVETGELDDRMESFVLSELFKYLYLLFDPSEAESPTNRVFSTEGQTLSLPPSLCRPTRHGSPSVKTPGRTCPAYVPPTLNGLTVGIEQRLDYEYARTIVYGPGVNGRAEETGNVHWSESGFCVVPSAPRYSVDIVLAPMNASSSEQQPAPPQIDDMNAFLSTRLTQHPTSGDFLLSDVSGVHMTVRWRHDNTGYDIATIGPHRVLPGQSVIVSDPLMEGFLPMPDPAANEVEFVDTHPPAEVIMRFSLLSGKEKQVILHAAGSTATFGRKFAESGSNNWGLGGGPVRLILPPNTDPSGCQRLGRPHKSVPEPYVFLLQRGDCTFFDKLVHAQKAGAVGVLVYDEPPSGMAGKTLPLLAMDEAILIRPSSGEEPADLVKATENTGMVFTTFIVGELIKRMIQVESKVLGVELMPVDEDMLGSSLSTAGQTVLGSKVKKEVGPREGKLALGEWVIWNLKIVDRPP
ncbi:glycoside hydrolase [Kockovaella imperatae]|uniref:alpha-1,2-Mannosidase n=1 Tax=Kockovaella imperatae TaxID=4999 RepID=A0A1Y1U932_9TREE|nr:glycoside hydrolase [Kockovaella imperatae]ORX34541.1 glycoside hydrolase [Kockovaella imperatae]